ICPTDGVRNGRAVSEDWFGDLEVWPEDPDRVLVRRVPLCDEGVVSAETFAAARTSAAVERFVAAASALWRPWRRERSRVLGRSGRVVGGGPVTWSEVILPAALVEDVRSTVEAFATARERYRTWRMPYKRGLLFHGAPGNGKTLLCRAIVTALGWPL